jgi:putative ABC transport system permease protein
MRPTDFFQFAAQSLWGNRLRAALSILGVSIGITAVLLLTALAEGARKYVTRELESLGATLVVVLPGKVETQGAVPFVGGAAQDLTLSDAEILQRSVPGIRRLAPLVVGEANAAYGTLHRTVSVVGTTHDFFPLRRLEVSRGSPLPPSEISRGSAVCVIGTTVGLELFGSENPLGKIVRIGESRFRVIGVLAPRGESIGINLDEIVMIPAASAMRLFNQTSVFRIFIEGTSPQGIETLKKNVARVIADRHKGEEDVTLVTQDAMLAGFNRILRALTLALISIAAISLAVAGVGIMNVMLVSVVERTPEIGLMKALGVTSRQVNLVFLGEAAILSGIGGLIGLILAQFGVAGLKEVFPGFPIQIPIWAIGASLGVAVGIGLLFGVWPAARASRLDPVIALTRK